MGLDTVAWDNNVDIAIDGNDRLHIAYFDDSNYFSDGPYVKYATNTSGVWTTSILLRNAWYPAIAIDKSNKIHIVYNTQNTLNYINNVSGNWIDSTITTVSGDTLSDIALDGARRIHVSYYSEGEGLLKYATCAVKGKAMPGIQLLLGD
jgi:hypothetical protein